MFNIELVIFIVVAVLIVLGGTYQLYSMQMGYGALLFFAGTLYVFILYGQRWFGAKGLLSLPSGSWPPIINTCPDYLTYYQRTVNGTKIDTCVDILGISKNAALTRFDPNQGDQNDDTAFFTLTSTSTDATGKKTELCQRAIAMGLTWEGVTNGDGCVSSTDGSVTAPSVSAAGSSCHA